MAPLSTFFSENHALHATAGLMVEGHPFVTEEVPARAEILNQAVRQAGFGPVLAPQDFGLDPILAVHDAGFVYFLQTAFADSSAYFKNDEPVFPSTFSVRRGLRRPKGFLGQAGYYGFGVGSPLLAGTWTAAYWSAQCALSAAEAVRGGQPAAYALCRPPGHHAAADLYGGFCYLNNAAIAARWLGPGTAVLDIDYHHGNGTQSIFYADPSVLFCSLHAHPDDDYPYYWGGAEERGEGPGLGFNRNWPLPQATTDEAYLVALDEALAAIRAFGPRTLVVSVGFDIALGDPVGGFAITPAGLGAIAARIRALGLPTVIVQEGGYLLGHLAENALAFLQLFSA
jgi:acetoin utilization deacetylase AcuC-like enzyme